MTREEKELLLAYMEARLDVLRARNPLTESRLHQTAEEARRAFLEYESE